jgi:DNA polymerase (family 10)
MNLATALPLAERIEKELLPMCERTAIAGSIRRRRENVNDIDLVILPKPGQLDAIKARCEQRCLVVIDGPQNYIVRLPHGERRSELDGFQVDIFFARPAVKDLLQTVPGNFGTLLLCRTGSKDHNIFLIEHAKRMGLSWNPYKGVLDPEGYVLASESEEEIFKALALEFVPPGRRER